MVERPETALAKATNGSVPPLELGRLLSGKRLVVVGGTGFLGKVWWSFLLSRYPDIGHIYLTLRPKRGKNALQRYDEEVATSEVLDALRGQYGLGFPEFLSSKVTPSGAALLSSSTASSAAFWPGGPNWLRSPVSGTRAPI